MSEEEMQALTTGMLALGGGLLAAGYDVLGIMGDLGASETVLKALKYGGWGIAGVAGLMKILDIKEDLKIKALEYHPVVYDEGPINSLYNKTKDIRRKAQNLWGIATALNFASQNCTCGQSYCGMPFCVSGIPLTPDPLTNPYCYLVYILRYPLKGMINDLEDTLK